MEHRPTADWAHSGLMLAARTTFPHFSVSWTMSLKKSAREPPRGMLPESVSCALRLGSAKAALIAVLSLSIISSEVSLGTPMPNHELTSYSGTNSLTVGRSGNASDRIVVVTANGRTLAAWMYSREV